MSLIYSELVKENKTLFLQKVETTAAKLAVPANWLMALFFIECTMDHRKQNKFTKAVGLIQFMPDTAIRLGTTVDNLLKMSNVQQLDYVLAYLTDYKPKLKAFVDLYFCVFRPSEVGRYAEFVCGSLGGEKVIKKIATQNSGFDIDKNEEITKGEVQRAILLAIEEKYHQFLT